MVQNIFPGERNPGFDGDSVSSGRLGASDTPQLDALLHRVRRHSCDSGPALAAHSLADADHAGETLGTGGYGYRIPYRKIDEMSIFVYMVDDDVLFGRAIAGALEARGVGVKVETDPFKALDYLCTGAKLDLILMDLIMPGMSGSKLFEELQRRAPDRCARLVFITGYADMGPKWLKTTGCLTLEKPVSMEQIWRVITEYSKLEAPRGPGISKESKEAHLNGGLKAESTIVPKKPSHPELPAIYDEEVEVTTDIIQLAEQVEGISKEQLHELQVRYTYRKIKEHETVVEDIQAIKKYLRWSWVIVIALGTLFTGVVELLKHVAFK